MHRIVFISCFFFYSNLIPGQELHTEFSVSPLLTFGSNIHKDLNSPGKLKNSKLASGIRATLKESISISNKISIRTGLGYSYQKYRLRCPYDGAMIPEYNWYYESINSQHSFRVPLLFEVKPYRYWYLAGGIDFLYTFSSTSKLYYIEDYFWQSNDNVRQEIETISNPFERLFNYAVYFSIGKGFNIFNQIVTFDLFYERYLCSDSYEHSSFNQNKLLFEMRPQQIGISTGIIL